MPRPLSDTPPPSRVRVPQKIKPGKTEATLQASIVRALRDAGHTVMVCGTRTRFGPRPFSPVTPGCPDLFVLPHSWINGYWLGLEVKRPNTTVSMGDKQLSQVVAGHVKIVRSIPEALAAVAAHPQNLRIK